MRLVFLTEHRFITDFEKETIFTTGTINNHFFDRFRGLFDSAVLIGATQIINSANTLECVEQLCSEPFIDVKLLPIGNSLWAKFRKPRLLYNELLRIITPNDIIYMKVPSVSAAKVVKIAKKRNIPVLLDAVGCPWDTLWNHSIKGKIVAPFLWKITRKAIHQASYVIYVTKHFLQNRYPTTGKSIGCSDISLSPSDEDVLEKRLLKIHSNNGQPFIIGTIGAVNIRYKGQQYVIKALGHLKKQGITNFRYQLVGGGNSSYLKKIAIKFGVEDLVQFCGTIPHEKIFSWVDELDIYIQPSKSEGLPRALIEAMSRALPALGARTGGIPELLDSNCLFEAGNEREICSKLLSLTDVNILEKESKRNFLIAKEYEPQKTQKQRNDFLQQITLGSTEQVKIEV